MSAELIIFGVVFVLVVIWFVGVHNGLIQVQQNIVKAANIEVLLMQRTDELTKLMKPYSLMPNMKKRFLQT